MRNTTAKTMQSKTMRSWMLGIIAAGLLATGTVAANAQPQDFHGRGDARVGGGFHGNHEPERRYELGNDRRFDGRGFGDRRGFEVNRGYGYSGYVGGGYVGGGYGYVANDYIPPCPGDGYFWTAGYYDGGYWVPGAWRFRGNVGFNGGYAYGRGFNRGFEHRDFAERRFEGRRGGFREGFGRR